MKSWPIILLMMLLACQHSEDLRNQNHPLNNSLYKEGKAIATIKDHRVIEASGLEYSLKNPGHIWTHNDSQGQPSLYLLDTLGHIKMTVYLEGATNYDWEDITSDGEHLYIAEIGDNRAERTGVKILMLEEPSMEEGDSIATKNWLEMDLRYQNGARDAETLMYDYQSKELIIVSKRDEQCYIYSFPFAEGQSEVIKPQGQIDLKMFTAGDINEKGEILIKNYDAIFYWAPSSKPVVERFVAGPDFRIPYIIEPQGEAITFSPNGSFHTLSEFNEHSDQQLYVYRRISID